MISNTIILNSEVTVFTATTTTALLNCMFHNFDSSTEETITLYLVKDSEAFGNKNELYTVALPSKMNDVLFGENIKIILESGDSLVCIGSIGGISNVHITYMEL